MNADAEGAELILELYRRRFEDSDGDPSDQPATCLAACEGDFSFVLLDASWDCVLAARSSHGVDAKLFWGTSDDDSLLLSSELGAVRPSVPHSGPNAAVPFPLGCYYYHDQTMEVGVIQRLTLNVGHSRRKVQALQRVNSSGMVCGLGFYSESGNDLAALAAQPHKYIS